MQHGFVEVRQRGSHIVMQKRLRDTTITIPVPNHAELRTGTLQSIIRQSAVDQNRVRVMKTAPKLLQPIA
jgi:predicted RNA binding protein YcfA (HicA-like mRNA interferase family)